ncbi:hypothetical protein LOY42_20130 [Pseudomonas sp. B21-023]|uniref:hypothetical protein n=1 Tax=unclassified Pseudomonas TaxID=196821 RepID=UPI001E58E99B|nr:MULTISPECIES: hypothetical protein [unclassified Pseudomonas]UVL18194.1 hypothetical protein LOY44_19680 [Pseudomonas sp. B21-044]UVM15558.1 hypothetical protein LOY42_20130 [Pseudomonas sp. B21-023]
MNIDFTQALSAEVRQAHQRQAANDSRRAELARWLRDTDWYVIRELETGKAMPEDIARQRADARDQIDALA